MDYYKILDVDINSTTKEIKKHYYKLAKQYHPDKTKGNKIKLEKFKYLSEAYSTLSNPKKRLIYDINNKYNINLDIFNFSEDEYELLHSYYNKIMNMTEIKFLKLLFNSLPRKTKIDISSKLKFVNLKSERLIDISNIKYIDISKLKSEYIMNLFLKFEDIYYQNLKQVIVYNYNKIYYLFITYPNFKIKILNKNHYFIINILSNLGDFKNKNEDLIYNKRINLYQYYYGDIHIIKLMNDSISIRNNLNKTIKYESLGLKKNGKRGDLIVNFIVDLNHHCEFDNKTENTIKELFNT
jgi:DnaJ-class molecular chaperone